jgi:hypothetical protein
VSFLEKDYVSIFVVCDEYNVLQSKPIIEHELDSVNLRKMERYNKLSQRVLFADFYLYYEMCNLVLLKNDVLQITIILVYDRDKSNLEFIGVRTIEDLIEKFPVLLKSKIR